MIKFKFRKGILIHVLLLISLVSWGQSIERQVIATGGEEKVANDIDISWTLGELFVETLSSENLLMSGGFQQGNLIVNSIKTNPSLTIKSYPNPVKDILIVEYQNDFQEYQILDVNGSVIDNGNISSAPLELDFSTYESGIYFLQIDHIVTTKIIKQ